MGVLREETKNSMKAAKRSKGRFPRYLQAQQCNERENSHQLKELSENDVFMVELRKWGFADA